MKRELGAVVGVKNVLFDPFSLAAHATDATDWRLHLPAAVVTPDQESQVAPLDYGHCRTWAQYYSSWCRYGADRGGCAVAVEMRDYQHGKA